jgi:hypothetical protein
MVAVSRQVSKAGAAKTTLHAVSGKKAAYSIDFD